MTVNFQFGTINAFLKIMNWNKAVADNRWLNLKPSMLIPVGIFTRWRDALKTQIPVGYQDESGFHFGTQETKNKPNWPPFW